MPLLYDKANAKELNPCGVQRGEGRGARGEPRSKRVEDLPRTKSGGLRANWMLSLGSWGQSTLRLARTRAHAHVYTLKHTHTATCIRTRTLTRIHMYIDHL